MLFIVAVVIRPGGKGCRFNINGGGFWSVGNCLNDAADENGCGEMGGHLGCLFIH